jgi:hypothetical protein
VAINADIDPGPVSARYRAISIALLRAAVR